MNTEDMRDRKIDIEEREVNECERERVVEGVAVAAEEADGRKRRREE